MLSTSTGSPPAVRPPSDGCTAFSGAADRFYRLYWETCSQFDESGTNVLDREWDVLVVLDACRADLFAEVAVDYRFLPPGGSCRSVGSTCTEWMQKTFRTSRRHGGRRVDLSRTALVTAAVESVTVDHDAFGVVDEVWRYSWDDELASVPAEAVTDRAIDTWRADIVDRMVVQYAQPDFPNVQPTARTDRHRIPGGSLSWRDLRTGDLSRDVVWGVYRENLCYVLESVEALVSSIDAERVVITADHGTSFGTWGLYGHLRAPVRSLRSVPWVELTASDTSGYEPLTRQQNPDEPDSESVRELLRSLGYD